MQAVNKREIFLHPILFAIYPTIALLANNIEEIKIGVAFRPLVISLISCILLYYVLRIFLKDRRTTSVVTSVILIAFFTYGHIYTNLETSPSLSLYLGRHRYLAPLTLLLTLILVLAIVRNRQRLGTLNSLLNWMGVIALAIPLFNIARYEIESSNKTIRNETSPALIEELVFPTDSNLPDVYYIVVDAYARDDTLLEDHLFDNTPFLNQLEEMGFYIAYCSQSNYSQTQLSLSSSLNMEYLQALGEQFSPGNTSRVELQDLIRHSLVRQTFEELGYKTVAFETGFKYTQWEDADLYLTPSQGVIHNIQFTGGLSDFEVMLINTSAGLVIADAARALPQYLQAELDNPRLVHRERILYALEQLRNLPDVQGPKLVFAHLVIPHPPYVFGANGEFTDYDLDANTGYPDQISYLNKQLIPILQQLITESQTPPIIILQADHGAIHSPPSKRLNILNAYYFPANMQSQLYDRISPVNSFRLVFNNYFGAKLPLKDDTGYYSIYQEPYDFTIIPETRPGCSKD
jgi:hypothetical protein